jgi:hypothetical protein
VTNFQSITSSNKLWTVPERGCRFDGGTIYEGCHKEGEPSHNIVHETILFHQEIFAFNVKTVAKVALFGEVCKVKSEEFATALILLTLYAVAIQKTNNPLHGLTGVSMVEETKYS